MWWCREPALQHRCLTGHTAVVAATTCCSLSNLLTADLGFAVSTQLANMYMHHSLVQQTNSLKHMIQVSESGQCGASCHWCGQAMQGQVNGLHIVVQTSTLY